MNFESWTDTKCFSFFFIHNTLNYCKVYVSSNNMMEHQFVEIMRVHWHNCFLFPCSWLTNVKSASLLLNYCGWSVTCISKQSINQVYFSLFCLVFLHLLDNKNKLREYWLPRITDKLIMIGSQFIHMFTTSLGRHTL